MVISYTFKAYRQINEDEYREHIMADAYTKLIYANNFSLTIQLNEKNITVGAGETLLIPPFTNIAISKATDKNHTFALVSFALQNNTAVISDMHTPVTFGSQSHLSNALCKYLSLPAEASFSDELLKKSLEYYIIYASTIAMDDNRITLPDKLIPVIAYIENNYWQNISVADLALTANISESAIYKLFVSSLSESPKQYIKKRRMYHALILLLNSSKSISDIAIETGFYDPFYFSKEFKKDFGMSPSEYRKTNKS